MLDRAQLADISRSESLEGAKALHAEAYNSDDMMAGVGDVMAAVSTDGQESEDKALIEHEQGSWECQKVSVC